MMKITGLSHLFKWENLHNWWLTKYFFAPLYFLKLFLKRLLHGLKKIIVYNSLKIINNSNNQTNLRCSKSFKF